MAELYRRYAGRLYRYGLQTLRDAGLAEETVQESFVRLWRTTAQFDARRGSVAAYLIVLARSAAADVRKRASSRPLVPPGETRLPPKPDSVNETLTGLVVREAVDSLSPAHRQVLLLAGADAPVRDRRPARAAAGHGENPHLPRGAGAALTKRGFDAAA